MNIQVISNPLTGITYAEDQDIRFGFNRAISICHPNDKFDESVGIHLAVQRLLEGCNIDDTVVLPKPLAYSPFMDKDTAKYIINYCVIRLGVLPGAYLDLIDEHPLAEKDGRPVQYTYDYEEGEYAILQNRLTGKIAVTKKENLIRA